MKIFRLLAIVAFMVTPALASAGLIDLQGGVGTILDDPPLTVGADWFATSAAPPAFFWGGGDDAPNVEGPFTYVSAERTVIDVTDDFLKGDRFEIFDFGISLGSTSLVAQVAGGEVGPQAAFEDPTYSSGSFILAPGAHSITIEAIENPYGGGRGYIRARVPEPSSLALFGLGALAFATRKRRKR